MLFSTLATVASFAGLAAANLNILMTNDEYVAHRYSLIFLSLTSRTADGHLPISELRKPLWRKMGIKS